MKTISDNPLELEDKLYSTEEFALALRTKFGTNDNLPDSVLVNIFVNKYPMYACKIKNTRDQGGHKICGCC